MAFLSGDLYVRLTTKEGAWIIEGIIPAGGLLGLYGKAKDGKSYLALGLAEAIANPQRTHFLGLPIKRHGPVAFFQLDNPQSSWIEKIKKLQIEDPSMDFSNVYFCDRSMEGTPFPFNILIDNLWLKAQLTPLKPILCIADTLRDVHPGDENDSSVMANVLTALLSAMPPGCALLIITHRKKEVQFDTDDLMDSLRGSSAIVGKLDTIMALSRSKNGNKGTLRYQGRDVEMSSVKLIHDSDTAQWTLDEEELNVVEVLRRVMEDLPDASHREWGRQLMKRLPDRWKTEEAAYQVVKRKHKTLQTAHPNHLLAFTVLQGGLKQSGSTAPDPDNLEESSINP